MIIDYLKNSHLYYEMDSKIQTAFEFLRNLDLHSLEDGKYEIEGNDIFALVQSYNTSPIKDGKWEAHRKYIDIQYIASGNELMGYANISDMNLTEEYSYEKDVLFLDGTGDFFIVKSGMFALFTPEDAHLPGRSVDTTAAIKKVLIKISAE